MALPYKNPLGYKQLRTWSQANEIFDVVEKAVASFPSRHPVTTQYLTDLKDQMIRSARSVVRNIEEGFARTTTKEYIQFLGFSKGSLEELLADLEYCLKGDIGDKERVAKGIWLCRGEGKMLYSQILSLENKMRNDKTMSRDDMARQAMQKSDEKEKKFDQWLKELRDSGRVSKDK